jgi:enoyl-CoA hydratase/carnithine racemase
MSSLPGIAFQNLRVTQEGPAARILLDRPEKRNALSLELMEEMIAALGEVSTWEDARAIVIEGAGPAFSAGHDLSEMIGTNEASAAHLFDRCTVMMERLHELPQPVIAKVHGIATAAGCQLVAACDLAVAGEGTPIDAATALEWGLVNRVVPAEDLEAAVLELVDAIARSSSYTVTTGKRAFYRQIDERENDAYERCQVVMTENALAYDAQEGMAAFLEKRRPAWRGA